MVWSIINFPEEQSLSSGNLIILANYYVSGYSNLVRKYATFELRQEIHVDDTEQRVFGLTQRCN